MMVIDLIFGFLLIFAGRNLFWLCVGIVGFLIGTQCAESLGFFDSWTALLAAFALGCLGAVLTMSFEWFMVIFGVGFLGGGYLLMNIFNLTSQHDSFSWMVLVVGGIVGMCLMVIIFDWTLILISSLLGATLIVSVVHGSMWFRGFLSISCLMTGIVVQYLTLREDHHERSISPPRAAQGEHNAY